MSSYAIETLEHNRYQIAIYPDEDSESPRSWDNLGTLALFHRRYNLPNESSYDSDNFSSWSELRKQIEADNGPSVILTVWMLDHSGLSFSATTTFREIDPGGWDSGMVGFIYVSYEKIRREYSCKHVTQKILGQVTRNLIAEIETYDQYVNGDVYGYEITNPDTGEDVDSCWGYYGLDDAIAEAKAACPDPILHGEPEI